MTEQDLMLWMHRLISEVMGDKDGMNEVEAAVDRLCELLHVAEDERREEYD